MTLGDMMERTVQRNALKFVVGRQMWCRRCETILDCKRAVEVEVHRDNLVSNIVLCAKCYDLKRTEMEQAFASKGFTLKANDGRVLFGRRKVAK